MKVYPRNSPGQTNIDVQSPWFLYGNGLEMVGFSTSILAYGFQGDFTGTDLSSTSEIGVYKFYCMNLGLVPLTDRELEDDREYKWDIESTTNRISMMWVCPKIESFSPTEITL